MTRRTMARADQLKKQVVEVWDTVKRTVGGQSRKARTQFERELVKLKDERDRLLVRLGEQTLTWINNSPVPVPSVVKGTVEKLNDVVATMKKAEQKPVVEVKHYQAPVYAAEKKAAPEKKKKAPAKKKAAAPKAAKAAAPAKKKAPNKAPVSKKAIE